MNNVSNVRSKPRITTLCCLLALFAPAVQGEPVVLHDSGAGVALPDYSALRQRLMRLRPSASTSPHHSTPHTTDAHKDQSQTPIAFPFQVPGLTVAQIKRERAHFPTLTRPVCVIGADDKSLAWLVTYHAHLKQLNATCLLVQAESLAALQRVASFARDLPVVPDLHGLSTTLFHLTHYPVLVSGHWIEQ